MPNPTIKKNEEGGEAVDCRGYAIHPLHADSSVLPEQQGDDIARLGNEIEASRVSWSSGASVVRGSAKEREQQQPERDILKNRLKLNESLLRCVEQPIAEDIETLEAGEAIGK